VIVADLNDKIVDLALSDKAFSDFEDGLQYYIAIENEAKIIITRNLKDFKASALPVMTAQSFFEYIEIFMLYKLHQRPSFKFITSAS